MKKGIALIELIFAIVIIGITITAIPNLIKVSTNASKSAITQESISTISSHMDMLLSQFWDENSTNPKYSNPILKVQLENSSLKEAKDNKGFYLSRRVGSSITSSRRYTADINGTKLTASSKLKKEKSESTFDDLDDFNGAVNKLVISSEQANATQGDYKDNTIEIKTDINYISDKPTNSASYNLSKIDFDNPFSNIQKQSTNIKMITVKLSSKNSKNSIILNAFSCNIGSARLKERKF